MIDFINPICSPCERRSSCTYPCLEYSNYLIRQHHAKEDQNIQNSLKQLNLDKNTDVHKKNNHYVARVTEVDISVKSGDLLGLDEVKKGVGNLNDIADYLEYSVGEDTWLKFINRDLPLIDLLDENAFMDYLEEQNRIYCDQNGLCSECRSPLERYEHKEEVWGSIQTVEVLPMCPNGCV